MIADAPSPWRPAYVALGSNLHDPRAQVIAAIDALGALAHSRLVLRSGLYHSAPMGPQDQPDYINAVVGILTRLAPRALLDALHEIERSHGRTSSAPRWGPRIIDLDIIAIGGLRISEPGLVIPHPGAAQRSFVLRPLADIAPALDLPGVGRVDMLLTGLDQRGLRRLDDCQTAP